MKIVLITPTPPDINAFGVRTLSSVMKKEGFRTRLIFLPGGIEHLRFDSSYIYRYSEKTLAQISDLCRDSDLIGFSFMSLYYDRAAQVTEYLKRNLDIPVIWGGTHPTYRPEQCLQSSDMVCVGEGEYALTDLVQKMSVGKDYTDVKSCWFNVGGALKRNGPGMTVEDLDTLPYVDYDLDDHYVYEWRSEDIVKIDDTVMRGQFLKLPYFNNKHLPAYRTMTSRGCPHNCSYCASSAMMRLRRRSVDNVIGELKNVLEKFGFIRIISFFDDTFFAAPVGYFEEFRDKYRKEIGLPFHAQCSPSTVSEEKMKLLADAGLYLTEMGIQTGSERIKKMYRRVVPNDKVIEAASLLQQYESRMLLPDYHVILDNPWETKEDVMATLKLLLSLPGRFGLQLSSLIFFPGTELNEKARQEGFLEDELKEVCRKPFTFPRGTYLNYLIYLSGFPAVPRWLLRSLCADFLVDLLHSQRPSQVYEILFSLTSKLRLVLKGIAALLKGDFGRIINYFRLAR